jgi:multisubunit Na+/H+ antiporter MnhC subunit
MGLDAIALFHHPFTLVGIGGLLLLALFRRLVKLLLAVVLFSSAVAGFVLLSGRWDAVVHALH